MDKIIFGFVACLAVLAIIAMIYNHQDAASGNTLMGVAVVVDKEHEIHKSDDSSDSHYYYFVVDPGNGALKRVKVVEGAYRTITVGGKVIVDTRVGGLSKTVVEETARPFEGAEAR